MFTMSPAVLSSAWELPTSHTDDIILDSARRNATSRLRHERHCSMRGLGSSRMMKRLGELLLQENLIWMMMRKSSVTYTCIHLAELAAFVELEFVELG
jgi:hypothetical protein